MTFLEKVKQHIREFSLLNSGDSVLVAVSGGADSVCLLDVLCALKEELSLSISVAHLNHGLRGKEADRDEAFVRELSFKYGVPFYTKNADVKQVAENTKCSLEEAGRAVRYAFFRELQQKHGIKKIATAHNKNDHIETVCMRFMRGTGLKGLCGIPVKTKDGIIRPLLCVSRDEIEDYLTKNNLSFMTDSSNLKDDFTRNKIRHHLIPYILENHNENFITTLTADIEGFQEAETFLEKQTKICFEKQFKKEPYGYSASSLKLLEEDVYLVKRVILKTLRLLTKGEITTKHVQAVYALLNEENSSISVKKGVTVYTAYGKLFFVKEKSFTLFELPLSFGKTILPTGASVTCEIVEERQADEKYTLYLPNDVKPDNLTVRLRLPGDKMNLPNLGHKKIKDILIDEKIPVFLRDNIPVLLYKNEIIWLCGIRKNCTFSAKTDERSLKISYSEEKNNA